MIDMKGVRLGIVRSDKLAKDARTRAIALNNALLAIDSESNGVPISAPLNSTLESPNIDIIQLL